MLQLLKLMLEGVLEFSVWNFFTNLIAHVDNGLVANGIVAMPHLILLVLEGLSFIIELLFND